MPAVTFRPRILTLACNIHPPNTQPWEAMVGVAECQAKEPETLSPRSLGRSPLSWDSKDSEYSFQTPAASSYFVVPFITDLITVERAASAERVTQLSIYYLMLTKTLSSRATRHDADREFYLNFFGLSLSSFLILTDLGATRAAISVSAVSLGHMQQPLINVRAMWLDRVCLEHISLRNRQTITLR
ncbi:hypothetical protein CDAR_5931 [Caerostris darwini]|uniref:Uncharacterized protein n=1 Tax=Caerostris darwini TaxID=1538125 RepID=A0AAV4QSE0_9ARAC|nr:hypothetical protein CDAR_5931 [Caerostris darwini]